MANSLEYAKGVCKSCESKAYITNRTHVLCADCNRIRLDGQRIGETIKKPIRRSQKAIPYFSAKGKVIKKEVTDMKKEKVAEARHNDSLSCEGCLRTSGRLDNSHILSEGNYSKFRADKENLNLLCRTCHLKWENGTIQSKTTLKCFHKDMAYIHRVERKRYWVLFHQLQDAPNFVGKDWHLQKLELLENGQN